MIGERIQYLRLEKEMTQKELAKELKVSLKTIQFYEQNRNTPETYMIVALAKYFNVFAVSIATLSSCYLDVIINYLIIHSFFKRHDKKSIC